MNDLNLTYNLVPKGFQHCAHRDCPRANECLRQKVYELCTDEPLLITLVNPAYARNHGAKCKLFHPIRTMRYARGFKQLLGDLPKKLSDEFRDHMYALLGHAQYYRARRGELPLDDSVQTHVKRYLAKHGVEIDEPFDQYEETLVFDSVYIGK